MLCACDQGSLENVKSLCEDGKYEELFVVDLRRKITPFMVACLKNFTSIVEYILSESNMTTNLIPPSALHAVIFAFDEDGGDEDFDINLEGEDLSPMNIFCQRGNLSMVQLLCTAGAPMELFVTCSEMHTPFINALASKNKDLIQFLVGYIRYLKDMSLSQFFNIEIEHGLTIVHLACSIGLVDLLRQIIAERANLCVINSSGETPLSLACGGNNIEIVRLLMETESRDDVSKISVLNLRNPFFKSFLNDNVEIAALLIPCLADEVMIEALSHLLVHPSLCRKYKMISWIVRAISKTTRILVFLEAIQGAFVDSLYKHDWKRVHFYIYEAFEYDPQEVFSTYFVYIVRQSRFACMTSLDVTTLTVFIQLGLLEDENGYFDLYLASLIYKRFHYKFNLCIGVPMNEIVWLHRSIDNGAFFKWFPRISDCIIQTIFSFVFVVLNDEQWKRIQTFLEMTYQTCYELDKKMKKQKKLEKKIFNGLSHIIDGLSVMKENLNSLKPRYDLRSQKRPKIEYL